MPISPVSVSMASERSESPVAARASGATERLGATLRSRRVFLEANDTLARAWGILMMVYPALWLLDNSAPVTEGHEMAVARWEEERCGREFKSTKRTHAQGGGGGSQVANRQGVPIPCPA